MKYSELSIETQRQAPNNARSQGFAFLVRAGYLTRANTLTPLGHRMIGHLQGLSRPAVESFLPSLNLQVLSGEEESFFPFETGDIDILHCSSCNYTERCDRAQFLKPDGLVETIHPLEKISTPDCNTIESLANFLGIGKSKTGKAMMFSRQADNRLVFVVIRGDMQLSEAKLKSQVGVIQPAQTEELVKIGAVPGYASPVGLKDILTVVDDLIPKSQNLVVGANEAGFHLLNANYGRDYQAAIVADLALAPEGSGCIRCGGVLHALKAVILTAQGQIEAENLLLALAETYHDEKGLTFPMGIAPFEVYLLQLPGSELDTLAPADHAYRSLQAAGLSVLFDDRQVRAGVKFNDADLIGSPFRMTISERNLKVGMVELKLRTDAIPFLVDINKLTSISNRKSFLNILQAK